MRGVVAETRRILEPSGSAVFILQPNSRKVGSMRPWLWEFMAWTSRDWNMVQDAYWWNSAMPPTVHCHADRGLMRPSMKVCVWLGEPNCYRDQGSVLQEIAESTRRDKRLSQLNLESHRPASRCDVDERLIGVEIGADRLRLMCFQWRIVIPRWHFEVMERRPPFRYATGGCDRYRRSAASCAIRSPEAVLSELPH